MNQRSPRTYSRHFCMLNNSWHSMVNLFKFVHVFYVVILHFWRLPQIFRPKIKMQGPNTRKYKWNINVHKYNVVNCNCIQFSFQVWMLLIFFVVELLLSIIHYVIHFYVNALSRPLYFVFCFFSRLFYFVFT